MAKFINFNIVGGYDQVAGAPDSSLDGDNLVAVDSIVNVKAEAAGGGEYNVVLQLTGGLTCTVTAGADAAAVDPSTVIPTAGYLGLMKKCVNRAITANPGGVKASCILPLDSLDPNIQYDPALKVYWKDIVIA